MGTWLNKVNRWFAVKAIGTLAVVVGLSGWAQAQTAPSAGVETAVSAAGLADLKGKTPEQAELRLRVLRERREQIITELAYIQSKIQNSKKKFIGVESSNKPDEMQLDKWKREVAAWETRYRNAQEELDNIAKEEDTLGKLVSGPQVVSGKDVIAAGETVELYVAEDESFNGLYQVRRGGYIILPRVGRVLVAEKTLEEAEGEVKGVLEKSQLRSAKVMIERPNVVSSRGIDRAEGVVYLTGQFLRPGPFGISTTGKPTLITTILRSGGVSEFADMEHVKVVRLLNGKPQGEEVNVKDILEGNGLTSDMTLHENDIIIIPAKEGETNIVYVTGNITQPGILRMPLNEELTVMTAVLRCGGFARFANQKTIFVLRDMGKGVKTRIPVNVGDVKKGTVPDLVLRSGDIVIVPEKFFSF